MPLHVIGLGVAESAHLDVSAQEALRSADKIIGSSRQLGCVEIHLEATQKTVELPKLNELEAIIQQSLSKDETLVLLASGDPLYYGIGAWVSRHFGHLSDQDLIFYPAVSSLQAACHKLRWSLQEVEAVSLHGRPLMSLVAKLREGQRYLLLTDKHSTPQAIASLCAENEFKQGSMTVCEQLGYQDEALRSFTLLELAAPTAGDLSFAPLNVVALELEATANLIANNVSTNNVSTNNVSANRSTEPVLFPGLPDSMFVTDKGEGQGMLTKREVRLMILSLLAPQHDDLIWDIGSGCGGVSVELALWGQGAKIWSVEHHDERLACLRANRENFGLQSTMEIISERAPCALQQLPCANKVFIGGSDGHLPDILAQVWAMLPVNGGLVASAVTETTRQSLLAFYQGLDQDCAAFESFEVAIRKASTLAGELVYKPSLPVTLFKYTKTKASSNDE